MVAETDVGGEGYGVVGMQLSLFILLGVWSERHIKPETAKTTREVSEQRQACGLVDYQPVAVERFQHPVYAVRRYRGNGTGIHRAGVLDDRVSPIGVNRVDTRQANLSRRDIFKACAVGHDGVQTVGNGQHFFFMPFCPSSAANFR